MDSQSPTIEWRILLKSCADFDIDLRNHDPSRGWDQGFVDN
ncbi:MAG TPA: hypothetical protein VLU25_12255 [Acidobacteriota bacterium]|nr:hypothetical protein [Acidobacteriota bacterium]